MQKYQVKYRVWYKTPPQSPQEKEFIVKASSFEDAENLATLSICVTIKKEQEAQLMVITELSNKAK